MSRRLGLVIALTLALVGLAPPVVATSITPISKRDWAQNQEVPFRWKEAGMPPAWMRRAMLAAAADATDTRGARAAVLVHREEAVSWVAYTEDIPAASAIGFAWRRAPNSFDVRLRPHGHVFDWGTLRWCQFFVDWPNGCFDAEMVTLHEFGHIQGLGHIEDAADPGEYLDSVMHSVSRQKPKTGWDVHAFGRCDVAALQTRYELLSAGTPASRCLTLDTSLAVAASATSVPSGDGVTFTATLRIAADAPFDRLAGDPLSSRTVQLQRRLPGSSSWSGAGLMSAGPTDGSYRLSAYPAATYEWRVLFTPTHEGLLASSSSIVKVTVTATSGCNPYCVE
jgi:hypothetical protein